jgi:hypothetical protein
MQSCGDRTLSRLCPRERLCDQRSLSARFDRTRSRALCARNSQCRAQVGVLPDHNSTTGPKSCEGFFSVPRSAAIAWQHAATFVPRGPGALSTARARFAGPKSAPRGAQRLLGLAATGARRLPGPIERTSLLRRRGRRHPSRAKEASFDRRRFPLRRSLELPTCEFREPTARVRRER